MEHLSAVVIQLVYAIFAIVSQITTTVNHKLNTPLAIIQALVELTRIKKDLSKLNKIESSLIALKGLMGKINDICKRSLSKGAYVSDSTSPAKVYKV
jgi:signal transduction histidine kinase